MQSDLERFALAHAAFGRKIRTYARNTHRSARAIEAEDVEAELLAVLWRCVQVYDPDNGAGFNTFAQRCFQNYCASMVRKSRAGMRTPPGGNLVYIDAEAMQRAIHNEAETQHFLLPSSASAENEAIVRMFAKDIVDEERGRRSAERRSKRAS